LKKEGWRRANNMRKKVVIVLLTLAVIVLPLWPQDIHEAAWNGDFEKVKQLLKENPQLLNAKGPWGWTPMVRAVYFNHSNIVSFLLSKGADPNLSTPDGETALHWAIKCGHPKLAELLIKNNANAVVQDKWGISPLQLVIENGYAEILEMLIAKGTKLDSKEKHYGRSFLHLAAVNGHLSIVKILLDQQIEVNCVDNYGKTPYYYAVKYGNQKVARLLESRGRQKNKKGEYEYLPATLDRDLDTKEAIIWYLGSCGWAIKTQKHFLIFDYWEYGKRPTDPSLSNGHIQPEEIKDMDVYVFVTHAHVDHYDPVIFEWEKSINSIKYIFGWKAKENPAYIYMPGPRAIKNVDGLEIYTINSHHVDVPEVAYLVKVDGLSIYFNGDYSGEIRKDIDYLSTISDHIDLSFAEGGASVTSYVLEKLKPFVWFPMHERGTEFKLKRYAREVRETDLKTKVMCAENRGDNYSYSNGKIKSNPIH